MLPEQMGVLARRKPDEGSEPSEDSSRPSTSFSEQLEMIQAIEAEVMQQRRWELEAREGSGDEGA